MHTVCNFRWYLRHNSCGIAVVMPIAIAHKVLVGYESVISTIHDDDGNDDNNIAKRMRRTVIECHQQEVYYSVFLLYHNDKQALSVQLKSATRALATHKRYTLQQSECQSNKNVWSFFVRLSFSFSFGCSLFACLFLFHFTLLARAFAHQIRSAFINKKKAITW